MTTVFLVRLAIAVLALVVGAVPARAHVLDEYLQATRLAIASNRIDIEIDLTPGIAIVPRVFASIDADRDGRLSEIEQDRYARAVLSAVTMTMDGGPVALTLQSRTFATYEEMSSGTARIRLRASAPAVAGFGRHHLVYVNGHQPESSVYLVNALLPADRRVELGPPQRDSAQRSLSLDFDVEPDRAGLRVTWSAAAFGTIGLLLFTRRRRVPQGAAMCLAAVGVSSGVACAMNRPSAPAAPLNAQFTLAPGDTSGIEGTELFVRFDRVVQDSRCPADVVCIQAGDATVGITVRQRGKIQSYVLHTGRPGPRSVVHEGVTISLEDLAPIPVSSRATPARNYRVTLRASR